MVWIIFVVQGLVPERPIRANPRSKILFRFCILPSYVLLRVSFYDIITVSWSKSSTVLCKLELP